MRLFNTSSDKNKDPNIIGDDTPLVNSKFKRNLTKPTPIGAKLRIKCLISEKF